MTDTKPLEDEWKTHVYGTPYNQHFSRVSEYFGSKGTILMQFYKNAEEHYEVRFTATKGDRMLPKLRMVPTRDYDKAYDFALQGMNELERIVNEDSATRHNTTD